MVSVVVPAHTGAAVSRQSPLFGSQENQLKISTSFVTTFPVAVTCSPTFSSLRVRSSRVRETSWSNRISESSQANLRVKAATEVAESAGASLRFDHGTNSDAQTIPAALHGFSSSAKTMTCSSRTFNCVSTEEELMGAIRLEAERMRLPPRAVSGMVELYTNYRIAVESSGVENPSKLAVDVMSTVLDRILVQFEDPFTFPSYHMRMVEPYDYYSFGQNYIRPLIDYRNSYVGNVLVFEEIQNFLQQGHNVFLFANHQTEADPAVMSLLLESKFPYLAQNLTYIAGDRVVLDPFCKPFSMGRNLLCVYSKKHIHDVPELVEMKQRANTRTLKEMTALLKAGGQLIWIAPSGGRDRPHPITHEWVPSPFDAPAVDNMRRLLERIRVPGHMYPMALLCHDIMPPPRQVEKDIGEKRLIGYNGVAMSVGCELNFEQLSSGITDSQQAKDVFGSKVYDTVCQHYEVINRAVYGNEGLLASTPSTQLSQPWNDMQQEDDCN